MNIDSPLWHEKLHAYQRTLSLYSRIEKSVFSTKFKLAAVDHLERALESVLENIANGNSRYSLEARRNYFGMAYGSALECAACLDILRIKINLPPCFLDNEKAELQRIVQMLHGLIRSKNSQVRENEGKWETEKRRQEVSCFCHERLDVYQLALNYVRWVNHVSSKENLTNRYRLRLDNLSTSIVLNIAEGNGRFSNSDHRKFIDIAYQSALKSLVLIDLMKVRNQLDAAEPRDAQAMLRRIIKMLLGMRGYLEE